MTDVISHDILLVYVDNSIIFSSQHKELIFLFFIYIFIVIISVILNIIYT